VGTIEIRQGEVGENEQQPYRELEQLDAGVEANVTALPNKWASLEVRQEDGHAEGDR